MQSLNKYQLIIFWTFPRLLTIRVFHSYELLFKFIIIVIIIIKKINYFNQSEFSIVR